jgi:putative transposase
LCIGAECRRGKAPGEPYEGKLHVRFDEGVLETELWSGLRHRRVAKAAGQPKSPLLWPPRQRPTLQLRNVLGRLPRDPQGQTGSLMRAAWKLGEKEGMAKFRQIASWLEHDYPDAARSLLEGLEECFTINRLDLPRSLHRCLATSNVVDNPHSGVRSRTRRVCRWRPGMAARWSAAAFLHNETSFRKIMGYRDLWALKAILDGSQPATRQAVA